jgi:hypothetical protein
MFENILWLAMGFIPTYAAMELAWKIAGKRDKIKTEQDTVTGMKAGINVC